jgi:hypothetical protein
MTVHLLRRPEDVNAYCYQRHGSHPTLLVGCFKEPSDRALEFYVSLLTRLLLISQECWAEFQSSRSWFAGRSRDRKLFKREPDYSDETYLGFLTRDEGDIRTLVHTFWFLKDLRFYYWSRRAPVEKTDILPRLSRTEFCELGRFIPGYVTLAAESDLSYGYLRLLFAEDERPQIERVLAECDREFAAKLTLLCSAFPNAGQLGPRNAS